VARRIETLGVIDLRGILIRRCGTFPPTSDRFAAVIGLTFIDDHRLVAEQRDDGVDVATSVGLEVPGNHGSLRSRHRASFWESGSMVPSPFLSSKCTSFMHSLQVRTKMCDTDRNERIAERALSAERRNGSME